MRSWIRANFHRAFNRIFHHIILPDLTIQDGGLWRGDQPLKNLGSILKLLEKQYNLSRTPLHLLSETEARKHFFVLAIKKFLDFPYFLRHEMIQSFLDKIRIVFYEIKSMGFCFLSGEIMLNPYLTKAGYSYEKEAIEQHLLQHHTDPITGMQLEEENIMIQSYVISGLRILLKT